MVAGDSDPPLIGVMFLAPAAFALGHFASLAIRVTVRGCDWFSPSVKEQSWISPSSWPTSEAGAGVRDGGAGAIVPRRSCGVSEWGITGRDRRRAPATCTGAG